MEKFLSILITAILVFYAIKFAMRIIGPWLLKKWISKMIGSNPFNVFGSTNDDGQNQQQKHDGKKRVSDELGGEYIDYEEIK